MSGEIASAYVSLYTKMPGLKSDVGKQLSGVMPAEGQRSGSLFASGMKLALGGAAMMGAINVAKKGLKSIYDVTIGGGIARAMAIDEAQAKLTGLGHTSSDTSSIMNSAIEAVTGPYSCCGGSDGGGCGGVCCPYCWCCRVCCGPCDWGCCPCHLMGCGPCCVGFGAYGFGYSGWLESY